MSPLPADEVPVPPQQGLWLHEELPSTLSVEQSAQSGEQSSIRGPWCRPADLATEDGDFVAEHDDLARQLVPVSPAEAHQLEDPGEGEVEEREGHGPVSSSSAISGKS